MGRSRMCGGPLLALLLLAAGCAERSDYFPLEEGQSWHYQVSMTTRDGTGVKRQRLTNLRPQELDGVRVTPRMSPDGSLLFYQQSDQGVLRVAVQRGPAAERVPENPPQLVFPADVLPGSRWSGELSTAVLEYTGPPQRSLHSIRVAVPVVHELLRLDDEVRVPAGRFADCALVHTTGMVFVDGGRYIGRARVQVDRLDWYAPGVGLVKTLQRETTDSAFLPFGEYRVELESYRRN